MKTRSLLLFVLMYVCMIAWPRHRPLYALAMALLFLVLGVLPPEHLLVTINWNVLMMIAGTMVIVFFFIESQMPNLLADLLLARSKNVMWVTIYMSLFSGLISAFIDNVATVLMVAPVALAVRRKLKIDPTNMILSIAISSNLQGAATLVGDTTSILLGDYANMTFLDFLWMRGRPGIFFAVELGALATVLIMMVLFRTDREPVSAGERTVVRDLVPTGLLLLMVAALIGASFLPNAPAALNGMICCVLALAAMAMDTLRSRSPKASLAALRELDFETLGLLLGLFVVIGGLTRVGVIDDFATWIVKLGGRSVFLLYTIVVWGSVLLSAFIDNIPYVATMLPVLTVVADTLGMEPYLLYFGLLSGATLGGNITPIGASANIAAVGLLRKEGREVTFRQFMRIGVPYTLAAVLVGYAFIWFVWA